MGSSRGGPSPSARTIHRRVILYRGHTDTRVTASGDSDSSIENLRGSNFGDKLTGDNNDNVLEGGSGADTLDGGKGVNTASYEHAGNGVTADLSKAANNSRDRCPCGQDRQE